MKSNTKKKKNKSNPWVARKWKQIRSSKSSSSSFKGNAVLRWPSIPLCQFIWLYRGEPVDRRMLYRSLDAMSLSLLSMPSDGSVFPNRAWFSHKIRLESFGLIALKPANGLALVLTKILILRKCGLSGLKLTSFCSLRVLNNKYTG